MTRPGSCPRHPSASSKIGICSRKLYMTHRQRASVRQHRSILELCQTGLAIVRRTPAKAQRRYQINGTSRDLANLFRGFFGPHREGSSHQRTLEDAGNAPSGPKGAGNRPRPGRIAPSPRPVDLASGAADASGNCPSSPDLAVRRHPVERDATPATGGGHDHPARAGPETDRRTSQRSGSNSATSRAGWVQTRFSTSRR